MQEANPPPNGTVTVSFVDTGGYAIPLATLGNTTQIADAGVLCPTPITDTTNPLIGYFTGTWLATGAASFHLVWNIGFGEAYLLPASKGYDIQVFEDYELG
jgi:hypothetical protein